jgi:Zn-dependent protease
MQLSSVFWLLRRRHPIAAADRPYPPFNADRHCGIVQPLGAQFSGAIELSLFQGIDIGSVLIQFAVLLFSLSIHEASHAWMADRCGDYTARYLGRVTLNPLAHMDPLGTFLFPLLQLFAHVPLIGWAKPVPVNPSHFHNRQRGQILVSLAGPGANLLAASISFVLLAALKLSAPLANGIIINMIVTYRVPQQRSILVPLLGVLFFAFVINLALAFFNLIPIPPLDGHWILYELLPYNMGRVFTRISPYGFLLLYALMFLGAFRFIFWPIDQLLDLLLTL